MRIEFYYALVALCCAYAFAKGGAPERVGSVILAVASILTLFAAWGRSHGYVSFQLGIFIVDLGCLLAFLLLAVRAERYWPLWITALQIIGTGAHAVKLADPEIIGKAYAFAMAFWSYPMWGLIALGTYRHQRRLALYGADRSWSNSSARSGRAPPAGPTV
jgi:hypothetical protein